MENKDDVDGRKRRERDQVRSSLKSFIDASPGRAGFAHVERHAGVQEASHHIFRFVE